MVNCKTYDNSYELITVYEDELDSFIKDFYLEVEK